MDREGVSLQVLSPIPVSYAYDAASGDARAHARLQNDALGEVVRQRPDRFAALGTVPLQDVDSACDALDEAVRDFGLSGVEIGTTAGGRDLDDPALDPFWERCEALDAIVFVHPESAPGFERMRRGMQVISTGYPTETGIAGAALVTSGLLDRRRLRTALCDRISIFPCKNLLPRKIYITTSRTDRSVRRDVGRRDCAGVHDRGVCGRERAEHPDLRRDRG
jgi:hypothetical protein